jgi:hypothetical protein
MREQMPSCAVRKLTAWCRSTGSGITSIATSRIIAEQDQRLCAVIQAIREAFAGYGYRCVTKALVCSRWKINHKRDWRVTRKAVLTRQAQATHRAYD